MKKIMSFLMVISVAVSCCAAATNAVDRVAVFGGSFSVIPPSKVVKAEWTKEFGVAVDDYGVGGAGFVARRKDGNDIVSQVKRAIASGKDYRAFVFWCSTNDARQGEDRVEKQEKYLREAMGLIRANFPKAMTMLFTSQRVPLKRELEKLLEPLVENQRKLGGELVMHTLDLWDYARFPADSAAEYFSEDGLHMNEKGYRFVGDFINAHFRITWRNNWGTLPELLAAPSDHVKRSTQRLHDAKWGAFNHYLGHSIRTAAEWNAKVNAFDVKKLADQLEACGAKFYFITLMQGRRWMCAPNATYDRICGTKPGEACSTRDLPLEIAEELAKRGIDLYLYYTGDGPYMDDECGPKMGLTRARIVGVKRPFVENWTKVLEEYAVRYGDKVKGWWIDGCYRDYLSYTEELLEPYVTAVRKGNPDAAVALNNGVFDYYSRYSQHADFTAGEFNDFYCVPKERFIEGAQAFALIPLAAWGEGGSPNWGRTGCKRSADYVADYVNLVNANGGVVAIDVHVEPDGSWDPEQLEVLKAVGRRTGTIAEKGL